MDNNVVVNDAKNEIIEVGGKSYKRLAVKTRVIMDGDDLCEVVATYAKPNLLENDILFITEKIVACTQGRAIPMKDIHPGRLAIALSHFVTKTPAGIGLGIPETMEMALHECGTLRILFAAFIAIIGKLFCQKGWFYIVAGNK
ncbi:MAG: coenzyme F420-0:L-glutamate ligase, partial [Oscillospiraceae bacterium]